MLSQNESLMKSSDATIRSSVLERFRGVVQGLSESSQNMAEGSLSVRGMVESVLVHLQFQDRMSQILAAVFKDVELLLSRLREQEKRIGHGEQPELFDSRAWIAKLERTMPIRLPQVGWSFQDPRSHALRRTDLGRSVHLFGWLFLAHCQMPPSARTGG